MSWLERIQLYYDKGLWDKQRVRNAVGKVIVQEDFEQITGESYDEIMEG